MECYNVLILFTLLCSGAITDGDYRDLTDYFEWSHKLPFLQLDLIGKLRAHTHVYIDIIGLH